MTGAKIIDPTVSFMTIDILNRVMQAAGEPQKFYQQVTDELRELTGAKVVMVIGCRPNAVEGHRLLAVNPERRSNLFQKSWFGDLLSVCCRQPEADFLTPELVGTAINGHFAEEEFTLSLVVPLLAGRERMGSFLLLGLPEQKRMGVLRETLKPLGHTVGLLLKNIFLVEEQDRLLDERAKGLRESESRLSHAQRCAGFGVWEYDSAHEKLILTPAAWDILRLPPFEVSDLKSLLEQASSAEDLPLIETALQKTLQLKQPLDVEFRHRNNAERGQWLRLAGGWAEDATGSAGRLFGVFQDITERRVIEERLRHGEKLDAIGQLAGGIAHDFNNMLSGILGYADLLLHDLPPGSCRQLTEKIVTAAQRSAEVARKLLVIARKEKVKHGPCDLHQILRDVISLLGHTFDKRIIVTTELGAARATTFGDQSQLHNVFLNLALNARDAMPNGGHLVICTKEIRITNGLQMPASSPLTPGKYIVVTMTDSGSGMTDEVRRHLFEPFYTTKEPGKGTGLGLTVVLSTITQHQGAVTVDSSPGKGTTFTVYLPFVSGVELTPAELAAAVTVTPAAKGTVLVVDDEEIVRKLTTQMMKKLGYQVETCEDGLAAVEFCAEHGDRLQGVILDIAMPRMNGRDAFVEMRKRHPGLPVLFCSGYLMDTDLSDLMAQPKVGFLAKPFRQAELAAAVANLLHGPGPVTGATTKVPVQAG